jgi:hypothetical protein
MTIPVNQDQQQRLLDNSRRCMTNAQSEWARAYWQKNYLYLQKKFKKLN